MKFAPLFILKIQITELSKTTFQPWPWLKHLDLVYKSLYLSRDRIYFASLTIGVLEKWSAEVLGLADEKQKNQKSKL